jgi:hypothetical protein
MIDAALGRMRFSVTLHATAYFWLTPAHERVFKAVSRQLCGEVLTFDGDFVGGLL